MLKDIFGVGMEVLLAKFLAGGKRASYFIVEVLITLSITFSSISSTSTAA